MARSISLHSQRWNGENVSETEYIRNTGAEPLDTKLSSENVSTVVVAVVGSTSLDGNPAATEIIDQILDGYDDSYTIVISGGAPGIDTMAEDAAKRRGFPFIRFFPEVEAWAPADSGAKWPPFGYRERNRAMALYCDHLYRISDANSKTYGSGWTADRAEEFGKEVYRFALDGVTVVQEPDGWPGRCH